MKTQTAEENKSGETGGERLKELPQMLKWRLWPDVDDASTEAKTPIQQRNLIF